MEGRLRTYVWTGILVLFVGLSSIILFVVPRYVRGASPQLSFLAGKEPIARIPQFDEWSAADIYSFQGSLPAVERDIERTLGDNFSSRHETKDGLVWAQAKDNSGLEIGVYRRREYIDRRGELHMERTPGWLTVYVHYRPKRKPAASPQGPSYSIVGTWRPTEPNNLGTARRTFFADGTWISTFSFANRNRKEVVKGEYRIENGLLIEKQTSGTRTDNGKEQSMTVPGGEERTAIVWVNEDRYEIGDEEPRVSMTRVR